MCPSIRLYACFGFYPWASTDFYRNACIIFAVASMITFTQSIAGSVEALKHYCAMKKQHNVPEGATPNEKPTILAEAGEHEREQIEALHYLFGGLIFTAGSILYLPSVTEHSYRNDVDAGTTCFIVGSLLFGSGAFVSGLNLKFTANMRNLPLTQLFAAGALWNNLGGAILYFGGSFFYFPQTESSCTIVGLAPAIAANVTCTVQTDWDLVTLGTNLYVAGAICYVLGAVCSCALTYCKQREIPADDVNVVV